MTGHYMYIMFLFILHFDLDQIHNIALPVYPVFKDEKPNGSRENSVKRKIALKKTNRTNIIATNFV